MADSDLCAGQYRDVVLHAHPALQAQAGGRHGATAAAAPGMTIVTMVAIGAASVVGLMLVLWLIHLATGNASIVDPGWAGGLALLGILYPALGGGYQVRSAVIAGMAGIWGFRLAIYLLVTRVIGHPEEGRYQE